jgi:2-polyprenyl-3-methyl-5-hydroxy-6-metoxy-1,4-benzoquinol methylase
MIDRIVSATTEYTLRDQERMKAAQRYFAWQARLARQELGRRVVEVGCGVGNFTRHLLDRELVAALDVEADCVAQLQLNLNHPANVIAKQMDVVDPAFVDLRDLAIDSIVCMNVLEHVRDDLLALRNMAAVLPPGGIAVLIVPAFEALYGPIDNKLGHYRRYSKKGMRALAASAGFDVKSMRYMNSIGCIGWWINAKILQRTEQSEKQIRTFDKFIVPPLAWLEQRIEPPLGQSLFVVLTLCDSL